MKNIYTPKRLIPAPKILVYSSHIRPLLDMEGLSLTLHYSLVFESFLLASWHLSLFDLFSFISFTITCGTEELILFLSILNLSHLTPGFQWNLLHFLFFSSAMKCYFHIGRLERVNNTKSWCMLFKKTNKQKQPQASRILSVFPAMRY